MCSLTYMGQIQSLGCAKAYLYVFHSHGINVKDLWMSAMTCWQKGGEVFRSNGRVYSVDQQLYINRQVCSAWQMGIILGQVVDGLIFQIGFQIF